MQANFTVTPVSIKEAESTYAMENNEQKDTSSDVNATDERNGVRRG